MAWNFIAKKSYIERNLGIVLTLAYVGIIPVWVQKATTLGRKFYNDMGAIRYYIFMFLFITMMSLPIKMVLRWLFSLKYIVALPEWELNL
jgi:hypothetical protein